ncbi:hypothetical protein HDU98_009627 [Podochytrium sp. JEL0797]|nr:hypothetical protein HDU98_009627 [Podochytrium sp. JEL0797]
MQFKFILSVTVACMASVAVAAPPPGAGTGASGQPAVSPEASPAASATSGASTLGMIGGAAALATLLL